MTRKGYSNDIKVRCNCWVVLMIMGVCLSDPGKVGLSLSCTRTQTHMLAPGPDGITLWVEKEVKSLW